MIGMGIVAGFLLKGQAEATPLNMGAQAKAGETPSKYQKPEDLLDMIPFLSDIPRNLIFGNGYKMKLGVSSMRIDHMGYRSSTAKNARDCMIGFSYTTPVAGFFTSRVDLPLVHSATPSPKDWSMSSLGDYTAYFSRGAAEAPSVKFVITAKF